MEGSERHGRVALVQAEAAEAAAVLPVANRFSLLRASVPARLVMAAIAAGLLWLAVLWALA